MRANARRRERGATLVEFAVIAPLLFLLLFGVIEFGRVISAYTTVWTGAREGARYATTTGESDVTSGVPRYRDCAGILVAVQAKAVTSSIDQSDVTIEWRDPGGAVVADCVAGGAPDASAKEASGEWTVDIPSGSIIEVEVKGTFNAVVPLLSAFLDGVTLDSTQSRSIYEGIVGGS